MEQILNVAARLLNEVGLTEMSMERLGRAAKISKRLLYNYFPSRNDLLRALLEREIKRARVDSIQAVKESGGDFAMLLRKTTKLAIENMQLRGPLLRTLRSEAKVVSALAESTRKIREEDQAYFSRKFMKLYGLPKHIAEGAVQMYSAMSAAAAQHFADGKVHADVVTEICVTTILASLECLKQQFAAIPTEPYSTKQGDRK